MPARRLFVFIFGTKVANCLHLFLKPAITVKFDNSIFSTLQQIRATQYTKYQSAMPAAKPVTTTGTDDKATAGTSTTGSSATTVSNTKDTNTTQKPRTHLDFTQMTRSQLSDWLSKAKAKGTVSSEQETAFKVLSYSSKTSSSSGTETQDNEQINFSEKAKEGLQSAVRRRDKSAITFWANALMVMKNSQGEKLATSESK